MSVRPSSVIGPTAPVIARTPVDETLKGLLPVIVPLDQFDAPRIVTAPEPPRVPPLMLRFGAPLNVVAVLMFNVPPATLIVPEPEKTPLLLKVPPVKLMLFPDDGTLTEPVD